MWEGSRLRSTDVPSHGRQGPLTGGAKKRAGSFLTSPLAQNDASKDYEKSSGVLRSSSEEWPSNADEDPNICLIESKHVEIASKINAGFSMD